jgi:putative DNA primase/helicase
VKRGGPWQGGRRWVLEECPWNSHTDNSAYIVRFANGAIAAGCHHNGCRGYGWRELREHFEPGCYDRDGSHTDGHEAGVVEWEDPVPLPSGLPEVKPFEADMLPMPLRQWVMDVSERMQIPADYAAAAAVTESGTLIGRKIGIHPKRYDDWNVACNLWCAIVGRPGLLKSPALAEMMKPLDRLVARSREEHEEAVAGHEIETALFDVEREKLGSELRQAAKEGDRAKLEEITQKKRETQPPEEPTLRRYKSEDPTVEKLCELLLENPQGILVHRDELSAWFRNLDKHGREGDRSFYLESWSGIGSFEVDRIGRGSLYIPGVCVSIVGGIQPGPLSRYVYAATQGDQGDDGLLQRFQLLVWPDVPKIWRNVDRWPDKEAKNRAYEVFEKLDDLQAEGFGLTCEEPGEIPAARFTSEAQKEFDAWRNDLEERLRSGELSAPLEAHLSKYRSLMPSLALIFQLVDFVAGEGSEEAGVVGVQAALMAIRWCSYLETHAKRLYASAENPAMEGARALLERIRKGEVRDGDSTRSIYRKHWAKLSTPEEVNSACSVLEEFGWLRIEVTKTSGRSTTRLRLHPTLREQQ